jgi:hypothetical protein
MFGLLAASVLIYGGSCVEPDVSHLTPQFPSDCIATPFRRVPRRLSVVSNDDILGGDLAADLDDESGKDKFGFSLHASTSSLAAAPVNLSLGKRIHAWTIWRSPKHLLVALQQFQN